MIKKEFIWLVIRFVGIFKLIISLRSVFEVIAAFFVMLSVLPAHDTSEKLIFFDLLGSLMESAVSILIIVYLLFFGKTVFNVIHRTSDGIADIVLEKQNYVEILIRFIGFWWLWGVACKLFGALFFILWNQARHVLANQFDQELMHALDKLQASIQQSIFWRVPLTALLYAVLAWYFLKHGKFFINLLNRLWLGKSTQDLNRNPVNPV